MTLRAFDVDSQLWRDALVATVQLGSCMNGRRRALATARCEAIVDEVLELIRDRGEDLDQVIDDARASATRLERDTALAAGRRAALEAALDPTSVIDNVIDNVIDKTPDEPCPDCGSDPDDPSLHVESCPRIHPTGHPLEHLQYDPPWLPRPTPFTSPQEQP